jgi:carboxypeptidase C (cathepsin A)
MMLLADCNRNLSPHIETTGRPSESCTNVVAFPDLFRRWTSALEWHGKVGFNRAPKEDWRVDGELAGFIQRHERFANVEILEAGHMVRQLHYHVSILPCSCC